MKEGFKKSDAVILPLAFVGLAVFLFLFPRLYPEAGIRMDFDKEEVVEIGTSFVEDLGFDLKDYNRFVQLRYDRNQLRYLNQAFGASKAIDLMADSIPVYHWSLRWSSERVSPIHLGGSEEEDVQERLEQYFGDIRLNIDMKGKPISFEFRVRKDKEERFPEEIDESEEIHRRLAEKLVTKLIGMYGGDWSFEGVTEKPSSTGVAYQYTWGLEKRVAGERVSLETTVQNERVQSFSKTFTIPEPFSQKKRGDEWSGIAVVILFLVFFVLVVVYFIQRLRADLIDLRSGLIPGIVVILGWLIYFLTQASTSPGEPNWAMMFGFIITAPFIGGGMWALFSVGESLTREVWAEKLSTLDTLRIKILFPEFGFALLRGMALIFLALGLISLLDYVGVNVFRGYFTLGDSPLYFWSFRWPSLHAIGKGLLNSSYIIVTFSLFLVTVLRRRFRKMVWVLPILFLLWSLVSMPIPRIQPFVLRMGINGLLGLLFVAFFLRYDFITVATGAAGMPILFYGVTALRVGDGFFTLHGIILMGFLGAVVLFVVLAYRGEVPSGEVVSYVPEYLQRIYERERIQRELEIARNVQLTFLPTMNPEIKGMDIASLCLPAKEVGGDYYDFIEMGPRKLGVVIGDVSGKGISAAFYMTLTKGFLKSQARHSPSPRKVLINMNELFYENSERGFFISMIYGVFDLDARTLTFARAGHNPMILRRSRKGVAEELRPPGIALGLEHGDVFARTIEERTIGIEKNDVFLFYTDGLNEAQNRFHEEFGEERLVDVVQECSGISAEELIARTQKEIRHFTAEAAQHDDMTAVVVKIL
jgi:hypothetical protein